MDIRAAEISAILKDQIPLSIGGGIGLCSPPRSARCYRPPWSWR